MRNDNFIDEEYLLLERPNIREECDIKSDKEMDNYIILYNVYSNLLLQFLMKKYHLLDVDKELEKHKDIFPEVPNSEKDLYQYSAIGYLKYFYLRNNIYIERLSNEELNYLFLVYKSGNLSLDEKKENFIEKTYLKTIIESPNDKGININYGPDNFKYFKPSNALIIGVRYHQFYHLDNSSESFSTFASSEGQIQILSNFLEYKVKQETEVPFYIIKYDEFSVNSKKKMTNGNQK